MENFKKILVTGGAGFIGINLIKFLLEKSNSIIYNCDKLSYASNIETVNSYSYKYKKHNFIKLDLRNKDLILSKIIEIKPDLIIHLAAESHVDRSINNPLPFFENNITGTFNLLEASRFYFNKLSIKKQNIFRFHHVSTDEVFGTLDKDMFFDECSKYCPRSPYSASKASSDHLVSSWHNTYGLPITITNCSNNYGPYQFPEKLIPITILKAIKGKKIPLYGDGSNIRDWIFVDDHIKAIIQVIKKAKIGKSYCVGGNSALTNKEVVLKICSILDKHLPKEYKYESLISFVKDRPGHDKRYAIDNSLIKNEILWEPSFKFDQGLEKTVIWYLKNLNWCNKIMHNSGYWGERLGL